MADDTTRRNRRANSLGAVSLRLVVALGASTGLTAAVALPMAYQAHQSRVDAERESARTAVEVLGRTTVPEDQSVVPADGLYWVGVELGTDPSPLHESTVPGDVRLIVDLPELTRVDLRVGDGPVITLESPPWQVPAEDADPSGVLEAGEQVAVATLSFADGRDELRRAEFRVEDG